MRWSLKLPTISGVAVSVHATLILLLVWIAAGSIVAGKDLAEGAAAGLALVAAIVTSLALREVTRVIATRNVGVGISALTLLPLGGIARRDRVSAEPRAEWVVALAGPLVNFTVAAGLLGVLLVMGASLAFVVAPLSGVAIAADVLWINLVLAAVHLIPGFPLDGGQLLRARLGSRDPARAARIATSVGQGLGLALAFRRALRKSAPRVPRARLVDRRPRARH